MRPESLVDAALRRRVEEQLRTAHLEVSPHSPPAKRARAKRGGVSEAIAARLNEEAARVALGGCPCVMHKRKAGR